MLGTMISPQNLADTAATVGPHRREGACVRKVVCGSRGLLVGMCLPVYPQSTPVLGRMVVG